MTPALTSDREARQRAVTYTVESSNPALFGRGMPIGVITDALTGRATAVYRDGFRIVLDEPLMDCCDEPVDRCDCACLAPVTVTRVSETQAVVRA